VEEEQALNGEMPALLPASVHPGEAHVFASLVGDRDAFAGALIESPSIGQPSEASIIASDDPDLGLLMDRVPTPNRSPPFG
jgi:hypothetical protein